MPIYNVVRKPKEESKEEAKEGSKEESKRESKKPVDPLFRFAPKNPEPTQKPTPETHNMPKGQLRMKASGDYSGGSRGWKANQFFDVVEIHSADGDGSAVNRANRGKGEILALKVFADHVLHEEEYNALRDLKLKSNILELYERRLNVPAERLVTFVFEWVNGGDLAAFRQRFYDRSIFPEQTLVWEIIRQSFNGLKHMHEFKTPWLHRDLKLDNILVEIPKDKNKDLVFKLADFGWATIQPTEENHRINLENNNRHKLMYHGTLGYAAPEYELNPDLPPSTASDVWSLGLAMYEFATMRRPPTAVFQPGNMLKDSDGNKFDNRDENPFKDYKEDRFELMAALCVLTHHDPARRPNAKSVVENASAMCEKFGEMDGLPFWFEGVEQWDERFRPTPPTTPKKVDVDERTMSGRPEDQIHAGSDAASSGSESISDESSESESPRQPPLPGQHLPDEGGPPQREEGILRGKSHFQAPVAEAIDAASSGSEEIPSEGHQPSMPNILREDLSESEEVHEEAHQPSIPIILPGDPTASFGKMDDESHAQNDSIKIKLPEKHGSGDDSGPESEDGGERSGSHSSSEDSWAPSSPRPGRPRGRSRSSSEGLWRPSSPGLHGLLKARDKSANSHTTEKRARTLQDELDDLESSDEEDETADAEGREDVAVADGGNDHVDVPEAMKNFMAGRSRAGQSARDNGSVSFNDTRPGPGNPSKGVSLTRLPRPSDFGLPQNGKNVTRFQSRNLETDNFANERQNLAINSKSVIDPKFSEARLTALGFPSGPSQNTGSVIFDDPPLTLGHPNEPARPFIKLPPFPHLKSLKAGKHDNLLRPSKLGDYAPSFDAKDALRDLVSSRQKSAELYRPLQSAQDSGSVSPTAPLSGLYYSNEGTGSSEFVSPARFPSSPPKTKDSMTVRFTGLETPPDRPSHKVRINSKAEISDSPISPLTLEHETERTNSGVNRNPETGEPASNVRESNSVGDILGLQKGNDDTEVPETGPEPNAIGAGDQSEGFQDNQHEDPSAAEQRPIKAGLENLQVKDEQSTAEPQPIKSDADEGLLGDRQEAKVVDEQRSQAINDDSLIEPSRDKIPEDFNHQEQESSVQAGVQPEPDPQDTDTSVQQQTAGEVQGAEVVGQEQEGAHKQSPTHDMFAEVKAEIKTQMQEDATHKQEENELDSKPQHSHEEDQGSAGSEQISEVIQNVNGQDEEIEDEKTQEDTDTVPAPKKKRRRRPNRRR